MQLVNSVLSFLEVFCAHLNAIMPFSVYPVTHMQTYGTRSFHHFINPVTFSHISASGCRQAILFSEEFLHIYCFFFGEVYVTIYCKSSTCNLNWEKKFRQYGSCHNNKRESSSFAVTPSLLPRESQWTQLGVQASRFFCSDAESRLFQNRIAHSMLCYKWSCSLMYHKGLSLLEQTYLSHSFRSGMFCIYLTIYSPIGISFFFFFLRFYSLIVWW